MLKKLMLLLLLISVVKVQSQTQPPAFWTTPVVDTLKPGRTSITFIVSNAQRNYTMLSFFCKNDGSPTTNDSIKISVITSNGDTIPNVFIRPVNDTVANSTATNADVNFFIILPNQVRQFMVLNPDITGIIATLMNAVATGRKVKGVWEGITYVPSY